jgi:hypothetical protein
VDANEDSEASHTAADEEVVGIRRKAKAGLCSGCQEACMHWVEGDMRRVAEAAQGSNVVACVQWALVENGSLLDRLEDVVDSGESKVYHSTQLDFVVQMNRVQTSTLSETEECRCIGMKEREDKTINDK